MPSSHSWSTIYQFHNRDPNNYWIRSYKINIITLNILIISRQTRPHGLIGRWTGTQVGFEVNEKWMRQPFCENIYIQVGGWDAKVSYMAKKTFSNTNCISISICLPAGVESNLRRIKLFICCHNIPMWHD